MKIINIGILAHVDAGKTTLTESLLYTSGAIAEQGNVDKGTTRTDTMILERQRGITIQTAVTSFYWNDYKINIVDTPGHMDFLTEAYRSLSVLDGAVLVISAKDGVQAQTRILFHALQKMDIPTIIFINKIDQNGIDLQCVYQSIKDKLTSDMIVMQEVSLSPKITMTDISDLDKWDMIISGSDELLERYVAEDSLDIQELQYEKCKRTRCCSLFPVYHGSAKDNLGTEKLIEAIIETFITETDDIQSELCGYVFKVEYTERKKRLSYLRLYHGTLHLRDTLLLSKKEKIKITEMCIPSNGEIVPADHACPGEIVILADDTLKLNDILGNEKLLPHKTRIDNPIKAVKRSKGMNGKPITSKPVYGYLMDEDENFIIDEEAAPVVKQIYNLCLAGNGPTKIARMLTEQQIPTPGTLEYRRTGSTRRYHPGYECKWATNTVVHILENREYTGCLVNFKTEKLSYKVKHSVENPPEKQVIFENHHEPIIDTQTWERVQELRKQRKRPNRYDEVGLFSGILFCADCGSVMYQQRYQTDKRKQDCYICGNYKKRTHDCTAHFIRTDLLTAGVLSNLRKVTSYAAKHEARFMKLLIEQNEDGGKRRNAAKKKELEASEKRIAELSAIFKRLYEDSVTGRISDERFTELSADYEAEQRELKERAAAIQAELSKAQEATVNAEKFMNVVRRHTSFEELTPTLLREFVEKIVVHECSYDENKTRRQDIEIYYSFVGKVDLPE